MDRRIYVSLLLPLLLLTCGFTWGLGKGDQCGEASKAVAGLTPDTPAAQRVKIEKSVFKSCVDGGAANYLRGISLETEKKNEEAITAYRSATTKDPRMADAHGRLGLLLLGKGEREEASVELITALQLKDSPAGTYRPVEQAYHGAREEGVCAQEETFAKKEGGAQGPGKREKA